MLQISLINLYLQYKLVTKYNYYVFTKQMSYILFLYLTDDVYYNFTSEVFSWQIIDHLDRKAHALKQLKNSIIDMSKITF